MSLLSTVDCYVGLAGGVLKCDIWTVATRAAVDLGADKVTCLTLPGHSARTISNGTLQARC